jgi:tricorn protease
MHRHPVRSLLLLVPTALLALPLAARAQVDARMLRQPDVSATSIAFVYAGDIWVVPKEGGTAHRLTTPPGDESFPRFSPDGSRIAFTGDYDGNEDVYVIPTAGGEPVRVTHHPMADRLVDWTPDGKSLLFASSMQSGRQRFDQFYEVAPSGGLPQKLPVPYGEFGALSPDGTWIAYTPKSRAFRTWKRYRGGWAPDIWLFNLKSLESRNITDNSANDDMPMWHGRTLYFLSDRDASERENIWAYDLDGGKARQVTHFTDFDIHFPAIGPQDLVFEAGGVLYRMDLATEKASAVPVKVITDKSAMKPRQEKVANLIQNAGISPSGKRAVFEARGDLFTVPAEHGAVMDLTRTSGAAERDPTWSPDGEWLAYWTDASGEYQLAVRKSDGTGAPKTLTSFESGFRYTPYWSPDSRKLAFIDQTGTLRILDRDSGKLSTTDHSAMWMGEGSLRGFTVSWSPDSRWLAYSMEQDNHHGAVVLYDTKDGSRHQVTSGFYNAVDPVFDPDGKYLYLLTDRTFQPVYSDYQNSWVYPNATTIAAVPLRKDVASPLAPRNDVEEAADTTNGEGNGKTNGKAGGQGKANGSQGGASKAPAPVAIDLDGFEGRMVQLPPKAGNYTDLTAASGKVVYRRLPRTGSADEKSPIVYWDLKARKEETVLGDADGYLLSANGKKLLVVNKRRFAIIDLKPGQKMEHPLATDEMEMTVDPPAEWRQIFNDVWRFDRDYFYDPGMHGVDWKAMHERYGKMLDGAVTRSDVNYVIGELIAELSSSHTYRGGGDVEHGPRRRTGVLGVDWVVDHGHYRIARIIRAAPWEVESRSPLDDPGVDVKEGDYVLAVNGIPLDTARDPWAAFDGLAEKTVVLTVNGRPTEEGARQVVVKTLSSDTRLRHLAWIEANRRTVDSLSHGRIGYVYVPSTGLDGQSELVRQFTAEYTKPGLIVDERFNSGGQIPDRFIELLNRPALAFWAVRDGKDWRWPPVGHFGSEAMLINGWSGSGGDAFPYYFKEAKLGPLVGMRTWGGLIGISGVPGLIDGGIVTVPTFRMYSPKGEWFAEGHGVDPDVRVVDDPTALARGHDPQLEKAVQVVEEELRTNPPPSPNRPAYQDRTKPGQGTPPRGGGGGR